jgi:MoxR-like ATPase
MLLDGLSRDAVLAAIREFDEIGRDEFLERYGYGPARDYVLVYEGKRYDSKAIAGVAYGYDHPGEAPLTPDQFVGGRATVMRVLGSLGFEVDDTSVEEEPAGERVWIIRAGREGEQESLALDQNVALIGWSTLGQLNSELSRDELKKRIQAEYGEHRPQSLASQAGQIYRFVNEVSVGDLVVLPLRTNPNRVAVGRIVGPYRYREDGSFFDSDGRHTHDVEWLSRSIPYERFDPDLRDAFGQQGTVSEVTKDAAAARILEVALEGADASAIHLVLKWSPTLEPNTIELHRQVVEQHGAVWWGRVSKPGTTGLAADRLRKFQEQIDSGSLTNVYLHAAAATWRTRLLAITTTRDDVDESLIPSYYKPGTHHSLWVKITDFEETDPVELTEGFVLAQSGEPVTLGALGNQTPIIIRKQSATLPARYFILNQAAAGGGYADEEGLIYHWTERSSGAWKQLANSPGANFVYYRPGEAVDGTGQTYFGTGQIASIGSDEREDGLQHFMAQIEHFRTFDTPVPWKEGPTRNAQTSIQPITRVQYEKLLAEGMTDNQAITFDVDSVRAAAEERGLILTDEIYTQLVAALNSGKHVILTGPPGTAKTTVAQVVAETARDAGLCSDYTLTTATADWTTFETIGGLRPTSVGELEFHEGHFLSAIRQNRWLVIDELNRSNFDRAFGQLFTVLSGQTVVLPYHRPHSGTSPLTLVPEGKEPPIGDADVLEIPQGWRIVATMNVFDKTLLFEMSFALMRRFAFIEVASPSQAVFEALIDREAGGETAPAYLAKQLLQLRQLKDLGPAVYMDLARYLPRTHGNPRCRGRAAAV